MDCKELSRQLRDGNFVNYMGKPVKCSIKTIYAISTCIGESFVFQPIEINEDWLIKLGFEKRVIKYTLTECEHYQNKFCWIYLIRGGFEIEIITGKERNNLMKVYNYVHQLQNIHYSIFGVELNCA